MVRSGDSHKLKSVVATLSFAAVVVGLWMAWRPLALILPGAFVFTCVAWNYLTTGQKNA